MRGGRRGAHTGVRSLPNAVSSGITWRCTFHTVSFSRGRGRRGEGLMEVNMSTTAASTRTPVKAPAWAAAMGRQLPVERLRRRAEAVEVGLGD